MAPQTTALTTPAPGASAPPVVTPMPSQNEADRRSRAVSGATLAKLVFEDHRRGINACQQRDLISEKLLLHIDGTGDFQWADILDGVRVEIPRLVSEFRKTENVLRLVVQNAIAHHTTMPLRYLAISTPDRRSVERAIVDSVLANHIAEQQNLNGLFAEALSMAMPCGFCPVHRYWREDASQDLYETLQYGQQDGQDASLTPGMIDCWVGNPFDTVFDRGARHNSMRWASYSRWFSGDLIRSQFGHMPGVAQLEGTTRVPSTVEFQMIARTWQMGGLGVHGSPVYTHRRSGEDSSDDMVAVFCREIAPGADPRWPAGRLICAAVPGLVDPRRGAGNAGHALLLADQPLPGNDFSFTNFYSDYRGSDPRGKPWIEPLDQLQIDLNIAKSKRWEFVNKMIEAPIVAPGGAVAEDMMDFGQYQLLEVEGGAAAWRPQVMQWPQAAMLALDNEISELRQAIFTGGGYQAVSRGESPGSRMAYRAIVALQQADNSIHGPVNMRFQRSGLDFMVGCHRQFKAYGQVPWVISAMGGDEFSYLAEPYIDSSKASDQPPVYKLVNAFGPSPELRSEEILQLMQTVGADKQPFLTTPEARRAYPDQTVFDNTSDPSSVKRRRALTIATAFHEEARKFREQKGFTQTDIDHPWVQQAGVYLFQMLERKYKRRRDDDVTANMNALSGITQDETADPIARIAADLRLEMFYQWQAAMAGQGGPGAQQRPGQPGPQQPGAQQPGNPQTNPMGGRAIAADMQRRGPAATVDEGERAGDTRQVRVATR